MGREEQIIKERKRKVDELRKIGINPYPYKFDKKNSAVELQEKYKKLGKDKSKGDKIKIAGRLLVVRDIGKLIFGKLRDGTGDIQILLQKGKTPDKEIKFFKKYIDSGDFLGISGTITRTKRGELSVIVKKVELLSKAILPLPEKWHGLQDKEERYRKRYLDLIMNPEVKDVFVKRAKIIEEIRKFLKERDFLEVETPALQPLYGGAEAQPFITKLNALDMKLYLSISPELYLKKLNIGGFDRLYTICKNFRNEGIDKWHNPEFTMMEVYSAYWDYNDVIKFTEELLSKLAKEITGNTKIVYQGNEINFNPPFKKYTMYDSIKKFVGIDLCKISEEKLKEKMKSFGLETGTKAEMTSTLFDEKVQPHLINPTFIIDYPLEICPLTKKHRKTPGLVERFELFVNGTELANAYSELNDPQEQEARLQKQVEDKKKDKEYDAHLEANVVDTEFVEAMKYAMPPLGGIGIGIDRLVLFLTNQSSIRDVILFPFMKI